MTRSSRSRWPAIAIVRSSRRSRRSPRAPHRRSRHNSNGAPHQRRDRDHRRPAGADWDDRLGMVGMAPRGRRPRAHRLPSILMAGPPADMTPALATVVREGRATSTRSTRSSRSSPRRAHLVREPRSRPWHAQRDDDPDPLTDPAIVVHRDGQRAPIGGPENEAWDKIRRLAGDDERLTRERLWRLNSTLGPVKGAVEHDAVKLGGWRGCPARRSAARPIGIGIAVIGAGITGLGVFIPMSGAVLVGAALVLGGIATIGFGRAMSQRTDAGARRRDAHGLPAHAAQDDGPGTVDGRGHRAAGDREAGGHPGQGRRGGWPWASMTRSRPSWLAASRSSVVPPIAGRRLLPGLDRIEPLIRVVGGDDRRRRHDGLGQRLQRLGGSRHRWHVRRARASAPPRRRAPRAAVAVAVSPVARGRGVAARGRFNHWRPLRRSRRVETDEFQPPRP